MEEVNKNTEVDNTDKKLHISDVMFSCWFITLVLTCCILAMTIEDLRKPLSLILSITSFIYVIAIKDLENKPKN